jgi:hypothetical protein
VITGSYRSEKALKRRNTVEPRLTIYDGVSLRVFEPWFPVMKTEEVRM